MPRCGPKNIKKIIDKQYPHPFIGSVTGHTNLTKNKQKGGFVREDALEESTKSNQKFYVDNNSSEVYRKGKLVGEVHDGEIILFSRENKIRDRSKSKYRDQNQDQYE